MQAEIRRWGEVWALCVHTYISRSQSLPPRIDELLSLEEATELRAAHKARHFSLQRLRSVVVEARRTLCTAEVRARPRGDAGGHCRITGMLLLLPRNQRLHPPHGTSLATSPLPPTACLFAGHGVVRCAFQGSVWCRHLLLNTRHCVPPLLALSEHWAHRAVVGALCCTAVAAALPALVAALPVVLEPWERLRQALALYLLGVTHLSAAQPRPSTIQITLAILGSGTFEDGVYLTIHMGMLLSICMLGVDEAAKCGGWAVRCVGTPLACLPAVAVACSPSARTDPRDALLPSLRAC